MQEKKLYYINPINNYKGDLYFEYWGEGNNSRYFIGINLTTGEEIYFGNETIKKAEASQSNYHTSIIINDNNNEDHIFSINVKKYSLEFINLKTGEFSFKTINEIFNIKVNDKPSYRNSIIKLKNGNYLLSFILRKYSLIADTHNLYLQIFNFKSYNMEGFNEIKRGNIPITNSLNASICFQTENEYLQCSYSKLSPIDYFTVRIYDLNLNNLFNKDIEKVNEDIFNYLFHIKNEIGAYIYFHDDKYPIIQIKKLKNNHKSFVEFYSINLDFDNKFTFNTGLFYSDAIKINDNKFAVILMSNDLLNIIICLFDLYNNDNTLRLRYFNLPIDQINIKISVNIKAFKFGNILGLSFYNSISEYPGYFLFNYPIFQNNNNYNYINETAIEIKILTNSSSYSFSLSENIILINNIFGVEIIGIKIINFPDKILSGIIIKSSNSIIRKNMKLNINDKLIFEPILTGAIPGKYILNFSIILKESNNDSFSDLTKYYGKKKIKIKNSNNYEPKIFIGNVLKLIFTIECKEECKTCNQLNTDSNSFCVKCKDEFPYFFDEKSECKSECNDTILINGNMKYCINNCEGNNTYGETDGNIYCRGNCENDQLIYKENGVIKCYDNCKERQFVYEIGNQRYCIDNCETYQFR